MSMAIYACKCDVLKKKFREDMYEILDYFKGSGTKDYLQKYPSDNPTQVARILKMSWTTVYKYMKK